MASPPTTLSTRRPSRRSRACYAIAHRTILVQVRRSVAYQGHRSVEDRLATIGRRINALARLQRLRPRRGLQVSRITLGRVTLETIRTVESAHRPLADGAILYLHGGGFVLGGFDTHSHVVVALARRTQLPVVHVEYRAAPRRDSRRVRSGLPARLPLAAGSGRRPCQHSRRRRLGRWIPGIRNRSRRSGARSRGAGRRHRYQSAARTRR